MYLQALYFKIPTFKGSTRLSKDQNPTSNSYFISQRHH
jgi:hypothetical protein